MPITRVTVALLVVFALAGCTVHHSRQALWADAMDTPSEDATFVTEEDSGLTLLGLIQVASADHYAVLLERLKRRHDCTKIHHVQLDFFTDFWIIVGFPIARVTAVCEHGEPQRDAGGEVVVVTVTDEEDQSAGPMERPAEIDRSTSGTLEPGDRVLDADNSLYDEHTFVAGAGYTITVDMESAAFDTFLHLRGPDGRDLQQNDDVAEGNLSSRIVMVAPTTGQYTVLANSLEAGMTGPYTLRITTRAPQ
jgi:hypothetical protein